MGHTLWRMCEWGGGLGVLGRGLGVDGVVDRVYGRSLGEMGGVLREMGGRERCMEMMGSRLGGECVEEGVSGRSLVGMGRVLSEWDGRERCLEREIVRWERRL